MKQWTTTEDFIQNGKIPASAQAGFIVETEGYSSKGDGGSASWKFTGSTDQPPKKSPAELESAKITDANGFLYEYVVSSGPARREINAAALGWDVVASWNATKELSGPIGDQYPGDNQVILRMPSYRYNRNGALIELSVGATGITLIGDGLTTQLDNIQINMDGGARCQFSDFLMRGSLGIGINSNKDGSGSFQSRQNNFSNLYIRDKINGIVFDGSTWNNWEGIFVEKCSGDGWVCLETFGEQINNSYSVSNGGKGFYIEAGGELKVVNFFTGNNAGFGVHIYGDDSKTTVEHYFTQLTSTIQQRNRLLSITAIVNSGGNIQVTSPDHMLADEMIDIRVTGTSNYNGTYNVIDVIDDDNFVLNAAYVADESTGSINLPNWDLVVESNSTANSKVNDMFFTGGNLNYTRIIKGFNIQFNGTRLKSQFYMDGFSGLISRTGSARGRISSSFGNVEASGVTDGLIEEIYGTNGSLNGESISKTVDGTSFGMNGTGVSFSSYYSGTTGFMSDDTAFSFTPQFSRGVIKVTNGAGQNARVIEIAYDTDTPNTGLAGYQGAAMEFTTGVLTGTTGTDNRITVSAASDGKIYIENRNGNQTIYWSIHR
tara:strand:- start:1196 stop:3001 length:1806 start_codon:yes stop_codon:yes gene_type:complete